MERDVPLGVQVSRLVAVGHNPNNNPMLTTGLFSCRFRFPQVDTNKLAALAGYTPKSATVTFGRIKQKLKAMTDGVESAAASTAAEVDGDGQEAAAPGTPAPPASPTKRSRKPKSTKKDDGIHGEDGDYRPGSSSPTKRRRRETIVSKSGVPAALLAEAIKLTNLSIGSNDDDNAVESDGSPERSVSGAAPAAKSD